MFKRWAVVMLGMFLFFLTVSVALAVDGATVYAKCKGCHGTDGKGNPKMAELLKITLAQLDVTKPETQKKDDALLRKLTKEGVGKMKGLGDKLKDDEISAVVAHLRTLAKGK